jgi:hypothetical protein
MTTLRFVGGSGAYRPDLPSHDVDAAELAWMAKSRRIAESEIVEAAVGSGLFVAEGDSEPVDAFSDQATAAPDEPNALEGMSRDELRAAAKDLDLAQGGSKVELIARIRAAIDASDDTDATTVATTVGVTSDTGDTGTTDVSVASVPIATDTSVASDTGTTETILPRLTKLGPSLPETPQA